MSIEKARLLIRIANQINNESDRKSLLALADEELASYSNTAGTSNRNNMQFPVPVFRRYKGQEYRGSLLEGWRIAINGDIFNTPSAAAMFISGHNENGWRMWRYIDESSNTEQPIDRLRRINY